MGHKIKKERRKNIKQRMDNVKFNFETIRD